MVLVMLFASGEGGGVERRRLMGNGNRGVTQEPGYSLVSLALNETF